MSKKMSPAEFKAIRERIGFSNEALARHWNLKHRTIVIHWSNGKKPIPPKRADQLRELLQEFYRQVDALKSYEGTVALVPQFDSEETTFPSAWHRAIALEAGKKLAYK